MPCPGDVDGTYADPESCSYFLSCVYYTDSDAFVYRQACPEDLYFNPETIECDWQFNVPSCTEESHTDTPTVSTTANNSNGSSSTSEGPTTPSVDDEDIEPTERPTSSSGEESVEPALEGEEAWEEAEAEGSGNTVNSGMAMRARRSTGQWRDSYGQYFIEISVTTLTLHNERSRKI